MLRQIKYFLEVVKCNSFTEADERCFISQSAISQQINALEETLGVKLLKREKRKFSLTPAGEYLYQNGQALLEKAEELCRETVRINVIKIRKYIIPNRYDSLHICSFFVFFVFLEKTLDKSTKKCGEAL